MACPRSETERVRRARIARGYLLPDELRHVVDHRAQHPPPRRGCSSPGWALLPSTSSGAYWHGPFGPAQVVHPGILEGRRVQAAVERRVQAAVGRRVDAVLVDRFRVQAATSIFAASKLQPTSRVQAAIDPRDEAAVDRVQAAVDYQARRAGRHASSYLGRYLQASQARRRPRPAKPCRQNRCRFRRSAPRVR